MIAYSSGRSKTFQVARIPSGSHPYSDISFVQKNIFNEKKKNLQVPLLPIFPPKAPLWKVLGTQKHGMLQQMSQAIKLLPLIFVSRWPFKQKNCSTAKKNAERKICDLRNLFSKTHVFFRWIHESPAFLTFFPSAASGSEKEPTVTATATAASGPAARGDGDLWGAGSTNKANLRRVGIKDIHHPQSILQQRMPRSFKKKKHGPICVSLGCHWNFQPANRWVWQVLAGSQHLWFADLFALNAAKSDW